MAPKNPSPPAEAVVLKDAELFHEACFIDGAWVTSPSGATIAVDNPATGEVIGTVPNLGRGETRHAIEAADRAFRDWRTKTGKERAIVLRKWFDLMMANQEDLARPHDDRAGQAARRVARRGGLRGVVPRVVR